MGDVRASLLGSLAVKAGLATPEQVAECLQVQQQARGVGGPVPRLGEIMEEKGYLSSEQVEAILRGEFAEPGKRFGELCVQMRFSTVEQVSEALGEQDRLRAEGKQARLGSVMVELGYLDPHQVPAVLSAQGFEIAECAKCRLTYNVSVKAGTSTLKCARCGRALAMVTGYGDRGPADVAGDIGAAAAAPSTGSVPPSQAPAAAGKGRGLPARAGAAGASPPAQAASAGAPGAIEEEEVSLDDLMSGSAQFGPAPARAGHIQEIPVEEVPAGPAPIMEIPVEEAELPAYGEFKAVARLGGDSLGVLYKAEHEKTGMVVALKVIDLEHTRDRSFMERFTRETRGAAALNHPNLKRVIAAGRARGHLYYASEFLEGKSVRQLIRSEGRVSIRAANRIVRAVADGLRQAHSVGIYHGDIRPSYIHVTPEGVVKLAETGVAKNFRENIERFVQQDGVTPFYIAPELATPSGVPDARSDIYELGATYFHMITGRPPFAGNTPLQILMRMAHEDPPQAHLVSPRIPFQVSQIIRKMMSPELGDRYQTVDEVIAALDQAENLGTIAGAVPVPAGQAAAPSAPAPRRTTPHRRATPARRAQSPARGRTAVGARRAPARGSGTRRQERAEGGEGRARPARRGSSPIPILVFAVFLFASLALILLLVVKQRQLRREREARRSAPSATGQPPAPPPGLAPAPGQPPPVPPWRPPGTARAPEKKPEKKPEKPPEEKKPPERPQFGRSLFGPGGEFDSPEE